MPYRWRTVRAWAALFRTFRKQNWTFDDFQARVTRSLTLPHDTEWTAEIEGSLLTGLGGAAEVAPTALAAKFAAYRDAHDALPRPGTLWPLEFASTERIDQLADFARRFLKIVFNMDFDAMFISDEATFWNLHDEESNDGCYQRILDHYGIDVADT